LPQPFVASPITHHPSHWIDDNTLLLLLLLLLLYRTLSLGVADTVQLVVISPLKRTLDTATLAFPPTTTTTTTKRRFVALECVRESLGE